MPARVWGSTNIRVGNVSQSHKRLKYPTAVRADAMRLTDHECKENGCTEKLRAREHGPVRAYPRSARTSDPYVPAAEIDQCVAHRKSDGQRCDNAPADDARVCGQHGGDVRTAAKRGFAISTAVYSAAVHRVADDHVGKPTRRPHVRVIERERPRGTEHECPIHGISGVPA